MARKRASETRPQILLLEDEPDWAHVLMDYLDEYDIHWASSLNEAAQLLKARTFALGLVDISLVPGSAKDEKGMNFIEELLTTETLRDLDMIIITAYPTTERVRKAFKDYRVCDFFDKGTLDLREFKRVIAELIAESHEGHSRRN